MHTKKITASIVGIRGYAGLELARLLSLHPQVELTGGYATSAGELSDLDIPNFRAKPNISANGSSNGSSSGFSNGSSKIQIKNESELLSDLLNESNQNENLPEKPQVIFLATPAEASLKLAPQLLKANKKVIDLSGAFRLPQDLYPKWYGFEHNEAAAVRQAHYGLIPWSGPATNTNLISNPGCYATATLMGLLPLLKSDLIRQETLVVDAKSGSSGAGKKASENMLFTEVDGECLPYKVGRHQHIPEIINTIKNITGKTIDLHFSTSLLPIRRGIIAGIYSRLKPGLQEQDIALAFKQAYPEQSYQGQSPFGQDLVRVGSLEKEPALLSLKKVVGTAKTHISYKVEGEKLFVYSVIDNLLKGAASQAIENMNCLFDFPTHLGLSDLEFQI